MREELLLLKTTNESDVLILDRIHIRDTFCDNEPLLGV